MDKNPKDPTPLDVEQVLDLLQEAKDHILREIGELVVLEPYSYYHRRISDYHAQ